MLDLVFCWNFEGWVTFKDWVFWKAEWCWCCQVIGLSFWYWNFMVTFVLIQVFDLTEVKPHEFVRYGLGCLEKVAAEGDECAKECRARL